VQLSGIEVGVPPRKETICAIYVTFYPDEKFSERLVQIVPQVDYIIIVDNHSNEEAVGMLRSLCAGVNSELIENEENLGIATALNHGIRRAIELGYSWAITFDQDSWPDQDLIKTLSEIYASYPERCKVKIIGSNYRSPVTGNPSLNFKNITSSSFAERTVVITSGTLICLMAYREVGPFRDDFFIDLVDHEYCLRIRSHGYKVLISCKDLITHSLGNESFHRFLWGQVCYNHSPLRRYYITRNCLMTCKLYRYEEPWWVIRRFGGIFKEVFLVIVFEREKLAKLQAMLLGAWHAVSGRMGMLQSNGLTEYWNKIHDHDMK
jgi:rhamnosyltransferase